MDTLKLAETQSTLWAETHILNEQRTVPQVAVTPLPPIPGIWCFTDDIKILKKSFLLSENIYVTRTQYSKADSVARSVRKQPSFVVHMDADHPVWFTESV
uniref:Uncharacterized protein n=1 Tax=Brassica oleracea TaxID=3712 RepID=A0A3P6DHQ8_BRAOL|nr:unnamed protein product [Brassica oleracea]